MDLDLQQDYKQSPFYGGQGNDVCGSIDLGPDISEDIDDLPYKVLDAPELSDDFYLNLVDWSESNVLAVGLMDSVYIWQAASQAIVKLHEFGEGDRDGPASLSFSR